MKVNTLKYFIATVAAMSVVCSCAKNTLETPPPTEETQSPITFSNVSTKAALSDLQTDGFGVWALISNSEVKNKVLMENQYVKYNDGKWVYSPLRYWLPNTVFNFIATYPYDQNGEYYTFDSENSAVNLTVTETPYVDYMIATNTTDTSEGFSETVDLQFKHLLTSVGLNIWRDQGKHQNDQMRIIHVTLGNIRKSGTYSSDKDKWEPHTEKITLEKTYEAFSDSDNIGAAVVNSDGTLTPGVDYPAKPFTDQLLIPQTLDASNKVSLKIYYQLWRDTGDDTDPDGTKNWEDAELEIELPNGTWEPNRRYTYNVVLSSVKDITFYYIQTKITPWGAPQVGGTIIIK